IHPFETPPSQRIFLELKSILQEEEPIRALERMDEYGLFGLISPKIKFTDEVKNVLKEIKGILAWFDLLYLDVTYEPWKVYFLGLTSFLSDDEFSGLAESMQIQGKETINIISYRKELKNALQELSGPRSRKNYFLYGILSPFPAEVLLYGMAKTKSENIKRYISTFFSKLKGTTINLQGKDLVAMGYKPGHVFKEMFERLLEAKLEGEVITKKDEVEFIKKTFGNLLDNNPS
ncbi:MAG TPA: hypothetical protein VMW42_09120, partial [Desulfatiglandales bacterium]|nr:hypothetical protein [Desulfatiglandales bacterium]